MGAMIAQRAEYLREVKKELACPWRERRRLLRRAEQAVDAFLEENPEAGQDDWYAALGAPEDMAGELLTSYDTGEIKRIRQNKLLSLKVAVFSLVVLVFAFGGLLYYYWAHEGYVEVTTIIYETDTIPTPPPPEATTRVTYHYLED
ncbi:hypothetical protein D1159_05380 [Pseudoflavonifractor sp. 524-17]|uniref:DUF6120 family protein n=1 Tax=Pseudoflavonifractor sp. 524-17 TaxID=2304577 RepID=UPI00137A3AA2|nr:DUF6120 family protein [Pseudoflavonifractor sp. 524-17]NCE64032.1 hypothetical protein [Pseudoflavonifractor sp. 524-17]